MSSLKVIFGSSTTTWGKILETSSSTYFNVSHLQHLPQNILLHICPGFMIFMRLGTLFARACKILQSNFCISLYHYVTTELCSPVIAKLILHSFPLPLCPWARAPSAPSAALPARWRSEAQHGMATTLRYDIEFACFQLE